MLLYSVLIVCVGVCLCYVVNGGCGCNCGVVDDIVCV